MKRILGAMCIALLAAGIVSAQISVPNTLTAGTTISAGPLNTNFQTLGQHSLDRLSGGTISGNVAVDPGITLDGIDIGATVCPTCAPTFKDLTLASPATGLTVGGNVIVNTAGKIPALTSTYFSSVSFDSANLTGTAAAINGSNITALNASNIASGTVPAARLGSGTPDATTFLRGDGSWQLTVPANAMLFFEGACPTGYTDMSATYGGRYPVVMPSGGTLSATVGTALTNTENRPVGQHNHTMTGSVNSTNAVGAQIASSNNGGTATALDGTQLTVGNAGTTAGTNAPYVQLRLCKKT